VTVIVDPELRDELTRAARENERSLGAEVRYAVRRHLEHDRDENGGDR
jgi:TraY domain